MNTGYDITSKKLCMLKEKLARQLQKAATKILSKKLKKGHYAKRRVEKSS